jgi:hypothetical protein
MRSVSQRLVVSAFAATVYLLVACAGDATTTPAADAGSLVRAERLGALSQRVQGHVPLRAHLSGAEEVPAADDDGSGIATIHVGVEQGEVCFNVGFNKITTGNRAHIHSGAAGVNGGIVVAFFDLQTPASQRDPRLDELEKKESLDGCVTGLNPVLLADIVANPQNYYVNVHNSRFPGGAVRAQLER